MITLTLHESSDTFLVLKRLLLLDQIDLVLKDDEMLKLHDLDYGEMLR